MHGCPDLERALQAVSQVAFNDGLAGLAVDPDSPPEDHIVSIVLSPYRRTASSVIPVRWLTGRLHGGEATPILDANIELRPYPGSRSQLAVVGSYDPSALDLPARFDRQLHHKALRATAKSLLRGTASLIVPD